MMASMHGLQFVGIIVRDIVIAIAPSSIRVRFLMAQVVGAVTAAGNTSLYHGVGNGFACG